MKIHALLGASALALVTSPALADTSLLSGLAGSFVGLASSALLPLGTAVAGAALLAAGGKIWGAVNRFLDAFERKTGIEVDAEQRTAIHQALDTGLHLAVQRGAPVIEDAIAAWVKASAPGAIAHFGLNSDMLSALVDAKLGKAAAAAASAPLALPGAILSGLAAGGAPVDSPAMEHAADGNGGN